MYWLVYYSLLLRHWHVPLLILEGDKENRAFGELETITFRFFHVSGMIRMIDALVE